MERVLLAAARTTGSARVILSAIALLLAACAGGGGSRAGAAAPLPPDVSLSRLPPEALALFAKSAAESCAVCRREARSKAFVALDEELPPGATVRSDALVRFVRGTAANELALSPPGDGPTVTFRFHTVSDHLVGVAPEDYTPFPLADVIAAAPPGTVFRGAVRVVDFAYGDGPGYLHFPEGNRLQVQCRVLEVEGE